MTPLKVSTALDHRSVKKASGDPATTGVSITSRSSKHLLKKVLRCFLFFFSCALPPAPNRQCPTGNFQRHWLHDRRAGRSHGDNAVQWRSLARGGCNSDCTYVALDSAELYNPATGTFSATGSMNATRFDFQTATLLPNGQVLIAGGYSTDYAVPLPNAELYDPATGPSPPPAQWSTCDINTRAILLPNGQVLIVGGCLDRAVALTLWRAPSFITQRRAPSAPLAP